MRFNTEEDTIRALASQISVLLLDVDGVLTDGKLLFSSSGEELKAFCSLDGHGIKMLLRAGLQVGIITGRTSTIVENRCRDLGITLVLQGQEDKAAALQSILAAKCRSSAGGICRRRSSGLAGSGAGGFEFLSALGTPVCDRARGCRC